MAKTDIRSNMDRTYITDIAHFLTKEGAIAPASGPAKRFADYLTSIVVQVTAPIAGKTISTMVQCQGRHSRKQCTGKIESNIDLQTGEIIWRCPACSDIGRICNWQGSFWDCRTDMQPQQWRTLAHTHWHFRPRGSVSAFA